MQHFYIWHWARWRRWFVFILIFIILTSIAWTQRAYVLPAFFSKQQVALSKGDEDKKTASLTFNISWGENKIHDILKLLKEKNINATFFVSGEWAERHPDLLEQIIDENHELGMLGYRYKSYLEQDIEEVRQDLLLARETFDKLGYENINLLRPPHGHFNKDIIELAENLNFKVIHWSVNPNDWQNPGTAEIVERVMNETSNGDIVLLHASDSAKQTEKALETIIPSLQEKKLKLITISEMINQTESEERIIN